MACETPPRPGGKRLQCTVQSGSAHRGRRGRGRTTCRSFHTVRSRFLGGPGCACLFGPPERQGTERVGERFCVRRVAR
eukprot:4807055-Prymnesium_polylepis.1